MTEQREHTTAEIVFRPKDASEPAVTMTLTGIAAAIHNKPEELRRIMEMLNLPEGTTATVTVKVSTTMVR